MVEIEVKGKKGGGSSLIDDAVNLLRCAYDYIHMIDLIFFRSIFLYAALGV